MNDHRHRGGEEFELRIIAQADDHAPAIIRLRQVLKSLLRSYRFRAITVREVTPKLPPLAAENNADGSGGVNDR